MDDVDEVAFEHAGLDAGAEEDESLDDEGVPEEELFTDEEDKPLEAED